MKKNVFILLIFNVFALIFYFSFGFELAVVILLSAILGNLVLLRDENLSKIKENG